MEGKDGVIARMLNDTRYMSKMAKAYLSAMFDIEKGKSCVWSVTGQMTALLRKKLGLNDLLGEEDGAKERGDHRHHAIDAFVIALTDRGMIKAVSDQARRVETTESLWEKRRKLIVDMDEPFAGFRTQLQEKLEKMVISFKPDHGNAAKAVQTSPPYTVGRLHEDSALGFIREIKDKKDKPSGKVIMAKRVPLESLQKMKNVEEVGDARIRDELKQRLTDLKENDKDWLKALADYRAEPGTRRVRLHIEKHANTLVGCSSPKHECNPYKYYATGGNYCVDIFCPIKGKNAGKWESEVISLFDAHQKNFQPNGKKIIRQPNLLCGCKSTIWLPMTRGEKTVICRVKKIAKEGRICLLSHTIAKDEGDKLSGGLLSTPLEKRISEKFR
jgi:CRISPR-associated endonuclease Csn1